MKLLHSCRNQDKELDDNIWQNIPSHNNEIRMMFTSGYTDELLSLENNSIILSKTCEIETTLGMKCVDELNLNDILILYEDDLKYECKILNIIRNSDTIILTI